MRKKDREWIIKHLGKLAEKTINPEDICILVDIENLLRADAVIQKRHKKITWRKSPEATPLS